MKLALPFYVVGVVLLLGVEFFAVRDDEDRRADDAGLVLPAARRRRAYPRLPGGCRDAGRAVRPDRAAA
ncbi:hypothetical protein G6F59_018791 [Rhizopus arrhizus]|nr:hypothetical protein G6F59_018791 [Rhizopus arrhizus]